jgi:hypothetical protein
MKAWIGATLLGLGLTTAGSATAAQEFACTAPDSVTGKAIGPTTLVTPRFACAGAPAPYNALGDKGAGPAHNAPFVVVNFKGPAPSVKTGDLVTLKGHFSVVDDPEHHIDYVVVTDAELVN